jgi:hypothetical protein
MGTSSLGTILPLYFPLYLLYFPLYLLYFPLYLLYFPLYLPLLTINFCYNFEKIPFTSETLVLFLPKVTEKCQFLVSLRYALRYVTLRYVMRYVMRYVTQVHLFLNISLSLRPNSMRLSGIDRVFQGASNYTISNDVYPN